MKRIKLWIVISVIFILIGASIFGVTLINSNFKIDKLFNECSYESKVYETDLDEVNNIKINLNNVYLSILQGEGDVLKIVYNEYENNKYIIDKENNILSFKSKDKKWFEYITFKLPLYNSAKIYIPTSYAGEISVSEDIIENIDKNLIQEVNII